MKALARRYCYWPRIDQDIEKVVKSCRACADQQKTPGKVPLHVWKTPQENWKRVHIDYAGPFQDCHFFVAVDARSKWPEVVIENKSPTTSSTINILREVFARNGIPAVLVSDNATIFTSEEFKSFCSRNGIQQKLIAPGHPATNGQAKRYIQTLKHRLKSMLNEPGSLYKKLQEILLYYRVTPLACNKSPAGLFLQRQLRIRLDALKYRPYINNNIGNHTNRELSVGERVQSRNYVSSKLWRFGIIEKD